MSPSDLASALLLHIEENYPAGSYLFSTPDWCERYTVKPLIATYRPEGIASRGQSGAHFSSPRSKDLASSDRTPSHHHLTPPLDDKSQSGVKKTALKEAVTVPKPPPQPKEEPSTLPEVCSLLTKIMPGIDLHSITPTPILLIHQGEASELLVRLADALSQKKAPARVVEASALTPTLLNSPLVKLLVMTPKAEQTLGKLTTSAKTYTMDPPESYLKNPGSRQPLWDALCALI